MKMGRNQKGKKRKGIRGSGVITGRGLILDKEKNE